MNSSSPGERLVAPCDLSVKTKSSAGEATPLTEATAVTGYSSLPPRARRPSSSRCRGGSTRASAGDRKQVEGAAAAGVGAAALHGLQLPKASQSCHVLTGLASGQQGLGGGGDHHNFPSVGVCPEDVAAVEAGAPARDDLRDRIAQ